jgi:y4mF family transcriptional regulator
MNGVIKMGTTEIGFLIRQERKKQKLTQDQLAAIAGVGVGFIRKVEHGKPICQLALVLQVLQTLGLKLGIKTPDD